ncbi:uncharacterized protein LOC127867258 [Dreissena polymorpha]|uniref:uncharacterized protein LOC127867258 n=1 Tax=Dreissena polymorpha TaxID=45954 RepID=UPI002264FB55|nr:uncharacterized protein LOC127867258 [Dreissena polymorpha]
MGYHTPLRSLDWYNRLLGRKSVQPVKRQLPFEDSQSRATDTTAAEALLEMSSSRSPSPDENDQGNGHETFIKLLAEANIKVKMVTQELNRLTLENHSLQTARVCTRYTRLNEEEIKFYTGLPSSAAFVWLVSYVRDVLPKSNSLTSEDVLLLVLMKIRINPPQRDIAFRFGISDTTLTTYFDVAISALAKKLVFLVRWPGKEELMSCRPQCFKETFPRCVSVIDCTEIFIEAPADFEARNATYSTYKHNNTLKYFVSY